MTTCEHCGSARVLQRVGYVFGYVWCADCGRTTNTREEVVTDDQDHEWKVGDWVTCETETGFHRAINICRVCPVQEPCLQWALEHHETGIWGGTTERRRQELRRRKTG
jgi:hypothetical protein